MKKSLALSLAASLLATLPAFAADPEFIGAAGVDDRPAPFSEAVKAPPLLFVSGAIGMKPDRSGLVEGGIGPETRATMESIKATLEANGSSMDRVVKCTVFLADIKEWAAMNEVYVTFFKPGHLPARSALGVNGLALNARTEIECIAMLK